MAPGQGNLEYFLKKGDSLRAAKTYSLSYNFYDSASVTALDGADIVSYSRALIGKGYALRFDRGNPDIEGAYQYLFQALSLVREDDSVKDRVKYDLYYGLAVTERMRENYDVAMEYGDLALIVANHMNDQMAVSKCYNMLANIQAYRGNIETGIENILKAVEIREAAQGKKDTDVAHWFYNLGIMSNWMDSLKQSNRYFQKALSMFNQFTPIDSSTVNVILQEVAKNFVDLNNLDSARVYYERAQANQKRQFESGDLLSHHYYLMGNMHRKFDKLDSALFFYQKSIVLSIDGFNPNSLLDNPEIPEAAIKSWLVNSDVYEILDAKATTLAEIYKENNSAEYLSSAFNLCQISMELLNRLRTEMDESDPSLHLAGHAKLIYNNALNIAMMYMEEEGKSSELMATTFQYIEHIKHNILLKNRSEDYRIGEDLEFAQSIKLVQSEIDELRREIEEAKIDETAGYLGIEELIGRVITLRAEKERLKENKSSKINEAEYQIRSLVEVKKYLKSNQLLINYFWGNQYLYGIGVSKDQTVFKRIDLASLEPQIEDYLRTVSNLDFNDKSGGFSSFTKSSFSVFTFILKPFLEEFAGEENTPIDELIVIPDGKINMLPFASLIQEAGTQLEDYKRLEYLTLDYLITYGFSASILMLDEDSKSKANRLIGFSSATLQGTQKELENISTTWQGDITLLQAGTSTEANFKALASGFDVIHIASHASSGDLSNQPNIVFSNDSSSIEDGKLFSYEIYPLDLSNRLTVLSACETGLGRHYQGEGVFSLARGFAFAGSSSVVTSLWKVRDRQTTELMTSFYRFLRDGHAVKSALRRSQLEYIRNSDEISAHPSFWSSFILIGSGDDKISTTKNYISKILWLAIFGLFAGLFLLRRFLIKKGSVVLDP